MIASCRVRKKTYQLHALVRVVAAAAAVFVELNSGTMLLSNMGA